MNMYTENAGVNFFCPFPAFYKNLRLNKVSNSMEVSLGSLHYITPRILFNIKFKCSKASM